MSMTIFAIVSAPLTGVLMASVGQQKLSKERTLAAEAAQSAVEAIRALPYTNVGLQNGNPTGTLLPTQPVSAYGVFGLDATVTTKVSYMDDAPSTAYRTRADYKRVIVTVTRNSDNRRLTQTATYVAPPGGGTYAGQNEGIVLAQVIDYVLNTPVIGASVTLSGGPSPLRTDTTDSAGNVVFPSLAPTTASQPSYGLTVAASPFVTMREDTPPSTTAQSAIVGGQTFQTVLRVYRPSTIVIVPLNANGTPYTGAGTATVSSSRGSQSYPFSGGQFTVQSVAGEQVVPNVQYTVRILASNGTYSVPLTALVPNAYPTDNSSTFSPRLTGAPTGMVSLTVHAQTSGGVKITGATVTVTGGPGSNISLTGTTNANGDAVFSVPSSASPGYTWTATSGALTGTGTGGITATVTKSVTLR